MPVCPLSARCHSVLQSWQLPLELLTELVDLTRGGSPGLTLTHQQREAYLAEGDTLLPAAIKLGLASVSAFAVWTIYWCLCVAQLGSHSVGGWLLAVVLRLAVWLWRLLVWAPPSWYPVQVRARLLGVVLGHWTKEGGGTSQQTKLLGRAKTTVYALIVAAWPSVTTMHGTQRQASHTLVLLPPLFVSCDADVFGCVLSISIAALGRCPAHWAVPAH